MPGGAGRELVPLEQHDIRAAHVRQVVRDGAANDAAADDDDAGALGESRSAHGVVNHHLMLHLQLARTVKPTERAIKCAERQVACFACNLENQAI